MPGAGVHFDPTEDIEDKLVKKGEDGLEDSNVLASDGEGGDEGGPVISGGSSGYDGVCDVFDEKLSS